MARIAKPHLVRGWWVTKANGVRRVLCPEGTPLKEVNRLFHAALAEAPAEPKPAIVKTVKTIAEPEADSISVGKLAGEFIQKMKMKLASSTVQQYEDYLTRFLGWKIEGEEIGNMAVAEMKPFMLENFIHEVETVGTPRKWSKGKKIPWKANSINHVIQALNACWNWALKGERIEGKNPWRNVQKKPEEHRERVFTPEEFAKLLAEAPDDLFREVLRVYRGTGLRPSELAILVWTMVDFAAHEIIIPAEMTKTGKKRLTCTGKAGPDRVVPMNPEVEAILQARFAAASDKEGSVFGLTYDAIELRWTRLRNRCGFKADEKGENLVLYSTRHTFATTAAENDVPDRLIGGLLGHAPGSPTTQRYINLAKSARHRSALHEAARKAVQTA